MKIDGEKTNEIRSYLEGKLNYLKSTTSINHSNTCYEIPLNGCTVPLIYDGTHLNTNSGIFFLTLDDDRPDRMKAFYYPDQSKAEEMHKRIGQNFSDKLRGEKKSGILPLLSDEFSSEGENQNIPHRYRVTKRK